MYSAKLLPDAIGKENRQRYGTIELLSKYGTRKLIKNRRLRTQSMHDNRHRTPVIGGDLVFSAVVFGYCLQIPNAPGVVHARQICLGVEAKPIGVSRGEVRIFNERFQFAVDNVGASHNFRRNRRTAPGSRLK